MFCSVAFEIFAADGRQSISNGHGDESVDGVDNDGKSNASTSTINRLKSNKAFLVRKKINEKKSTEKFIGNTGTYQQRIRPQVDDGELLQRASSVKQTRAAVIGEGEDDDDYYSRRRARFLFRQRVGK